MPYSCLVHIRTQVEKALNEARARIAELEVAVQMWIVNPSPKCSAGNSGGAADVKSWRHVCIVPGTFWVEESLLLKCLVDS